MLEEENGKAPLYLERILKDEDGNLVINLCIVRPGKDLNFVPHKNYEIIDKNKKIRVKNIFHDPCPADVICKLDFHFYCKPTLPEEITVSKLEILIPLSHFSKHNCEFIILTMKGNGEPTNGEPKSHSNVETEEGIIIFEPPPDLDKTK